MKKRMWLWHPESPGERVLVERNWLQQRIYPVAFATLHESMKSSVIEAPMTEAEIFVKHIESHLAPGQPVICKICGKTITEIVESD